MLREIARVLHTGGRFVHLGVHPCFVGAFADWSGQPEIVVDESVPRVYQNESSLNGEWWPVACG